MSLSGKAASNARRSRKMTIIVCLLFSGVGLVFTVLLAGVARKVIAARSWQPTSCTILESRLVRDNEGLCGVSARFSYQIGGASYVADRYEFFQSYSSACDSHRETVDRLRAGTPVECWVDPAHPTEAVIDR